MKNKQITIRTFRKPNTAKYAQLILSKNNINSTLGNENVSEAIVYYTSTDGFINLQVDEKDVEQTIKVLSKHGFNFKDDDDYAKYLFPPCKLCLSNNISKNKLPIILRIISAILLFIPYIFIKNKYKCNVCNYSWEEPNSLMNIFSNIIDKITSS